MSIPAQDRKTHSMNRRKYNLLVKRTSIEVWKMVEQKVGLECKWTEWKVRWCSSVMDTTENTRATCYASCEDKRFFVRDTTLHVVMRHARKIHVCGSAKCACLCERVLCSVYRFNTLPLGAGPRAPQAEAMALHCHGPCTWRTLGHCATCLETAGGALCGT